MPKKICIIKWNDCFWPFRLSSLVQTILCRVIDSCFWFTLLQNHFCKLYFFQILHMNKPTRNDREKPVGNYEETKRGIHSILDYVWYRVIHENVSGDVVSDVCYTIYIIYTLSIYPSAQKKWDDISRTLLWIRLNLPLPLDFKRRKRRKGDNEVNKYL